jgi:hypothetical protein
MADIMNATTGPRRGARVAPMYRTTLKSRIAKVAAAKPSSEPCDRCAADAFLQWHDAQLVPSFNVEIAFQPPPGKRLVIELVTAMVEVPAGESARLRMFTGFSNGQTGNFDLVLKSQGIVNGQSIYVATSSLRTYTDGFLAFNVNRDNAVTTGSALICVSGYVV